MRLLYGGARFSSGKDAAHVKHKASAFAFVTVFASLGQQAAEGVTLVGFRQAHKLLYLIHIHAQLVAACFADGRQNLRSDPFTKAFGFCLARTEDERITTPALRSSRSRARS